MYIFEVIYFPAHLKQVKQKKDGKLIIKEKGGSWQLKNEDGQVIKTGQNAPDPNEIADETIELEGSGFKLEVGELESSSSAAAAVSSPTTARPAAAATQPSKPKLNSSSSIRPATTMMRRVGSAASTKQETEESDGGVDDDEDGDTIRPSARTQFPKRIARKPQFSRQDDDDDNDEDDEQIERSKTKHNSFRQDAVSAALASAVSRPATASLSKYRIPQSNLHQRSQYGASLPQRQKSSTQPPQQHQQMEVKPAPLEGTYQQSVDEYSWGSSLQQSLDTQIQTMQQNEMHLAEEDRASAAVVSAPRSVPQPPFPRDPFPPQRKPQNRPGTVIDDDNSDEEEQDFRMTKKISAPLPRKPAPQRADPAASSKQQSFQPAKAQQPSKEMIASSGTRFVNPMRSQSQPAQASRQPAYNAQGAASRGSSASKPAPVSKDVSHINEMTGKDVLYFVSRVANSTHSLIFPDLGILQPFLLKNVMPKRHVFIPDKFKNFEMYVSTFMNAIYEEMNLQMFEQALKFRKGYAAITKSTEPKASDDSDSKIPCCKCKSRPKAKLLFVKKEGPNKGKPFYTCPMGQGAQCDFFQWVTGALPQSAAAPQQHQIIEDPKGRMEYFKKQGIDYYPTCVLIRSTPKQDLFGKQDESDEGAQVPASQISWYIQFDKKLYTEYSVDDVWIFSTSDDFNPREAPVVIARSLLHGPSSNGILQVEIVQGKPPSKGQTDGFAIKGPNLATSFELVQHLEKMQKEKLYPPLLYNMLDKQPFPKPSNYPPEVDFKLRLSNEVIDEKATEYCEKYSLNEDQRKVLRTCAQWFKRDVAQEDKPIVLVHGVFGAGKSFLLVVIIKFICEILDMDDEADLEAEQDKEEAGDSMEDDDADAEENKDDGLEEEEEFKFDSDVDAKQKVDAGQGEDDDNEKPPMKIKKKSAASRKKGEASSSAAEPQQKQKPRILISSVTNVAVDNILQGLLEHGYDKFVRVGSVKKIARQLLPYMVSTDRDSQKAARDLRARLKECDSEEERAAVERALERTKGRMNEGRQSSVKEARVVGVTLAATSFEVLQDNVFPILIMDECSQCLEPLSLLPISRFRCQKLIAVGDPLQLPPTVAGAAASSSSEDTIEKTLFIRLAKVGHSPILLRTQYRCHPYISRISNIMFYANKLIDGVTEVQRHPLVRKLPAVMFINTVGKEEKAEGSWCNTIEVQTVTKLCRMLLNTDLVSTDQIGIITLYRTQRNRLETAINKDENLHGIKVSTIDAFQGGEKDIIIISTVKTTGDQTFFETSERLNVAITRAKHHLIIVGEAQFLGKSSQWGVVLQQAENLKGKFDSFALDSGKFDFLVDPPLRPDSLDAPKETGKSKMASSDFIMNLLESYSPYRGKKGPVRGKVIDDDDDGGKPMPVVNLTDRFNQIAAKAALQQTPLIEEIEVPASAALSTPSTFAQKRKRNVVEDDDDSEIVQAAQSPSEVVASTPYASSSLADSGIPYKRLRLSDGSPASASGYAMDEEDDAQPGSPASITSVEMAAMDATAAMDEEYASLVSDFELPAAAAVPSVEQPSDVSATMSAEQPYSASSVNFGLPQFHLQAGAYMGFSMFQPLGTSNSNNSAQSAPAAAEDDDELLF